VLAARIHIDAHWAADLIGALDDADCRVVRRDDDIVDVLVPARNDQDQARMELTFFLKAWALDHPRAGLRVGRLG
jgi:hypothetical protein